MFRSITYFFPVLLLVLAIGCGSGKSPNPGYEYVEGIVTLDDEPVSGASVAFFPITDTPPMETATGVTNEKGVYRLLSKTLVGAVAGEYKVLIAKTTPPQTEDFSQAQDLLPGIYKHPKNTPLTATVNKGRNKIDFELKSKP